MTKTVEVYKATVIIDDLYCSLNDALRLQYPLNETIYAPTTNSGKIMPLMGFETKPLAENFAIRLMRNRKDPILFGPKEVFPSAILRCEVVPYDHSAIIVAPWISNMFDMFWSGELVVSNDSMLGVLGFASTPPGTVFCSQVKPLEVVRVIEPEEI